MSWHADPGLLGEYIAGGLGDVRALSVEAHVLGCETCRRQLADVADRARLDAVWDRVSRTGPSRSASLCAWGCRTISLASLPRRRP